MQGDKDWKKRENNTNQRGIAFEMVRCLHFEKHNHKNAFLQSNNSANASLRQWKCASASQTTDHKAQHETTALQNCTME